MKQWKKIGENIKFSFIKFDFGHPAQVSIKLRGSMTIHEIEQKQVDFYFHKL